MSSNYSYETSKPAHEENKALNKRRQCDQVLAIIRKGGDNLLQIATVSGLPQSTISARMNDLIDEGKAQYKGKVVYMDRLRKKVVVIEPLLPVLQKNLFDE